MWPLFWLSDSSWNDHATVAKNKTFYVHTALPEFSLEEKKSVKLWRGPPLTAPFIPPALLIFSLLKQLHTCFCKPHYVLGVLDYWYCKYFKYLNFDNETRTCQTDLNSGTYQNRVCGVIDGYLWFLGVNTLTEEGWQTLLWSLSMALHIL